jgi:cytochrome c1
MGCLGDQRLAGMLMWIMIRWIQHPQEVDLKNAMPNMDVTDQDARDIAAFLYTLR